MKHNCQSSTRSSSTVIDCFRTLFVIISRLFSCGVSYAIFFWEENPVLDQPGSQSLVPCLTSLVLRNPVSNLRPPTPDEDALTIAVTRPTPSQLLNKPLP